MNSLVADVLLVLLPLAALGGTGLWLAQESMRVVRDADSVRIPYQRRDTHVEVEDVDLGGRTCLGVQPGVRQSAASALRRQGHEGDQPHSQGQGATGGLSGGGWKLGKSEKGEIQVM